MDLFGFAKRRIEKHKKTYRDMSPEERQRHFKRLEMISKEMAANPFRNNALIEMCKAALAVDEEDAAKKLH